MLFDFEGPKRILKKKREERRSETLKQTRRSLVWQISFDGNRMKFLWGCSSAGRAPALHAGGQEFDPPHLHQRVKVDEEDREKAETKWAHSSGG